MGKIWGVDKMNVIFLDIDGVLVTPDSMRLPRLEVEGHSFPTHRFYQPAVVALNRVIRETGAQIVVSSSWRGDPDSIPKLQRIFDVHGVVGTIIGVTPRNGVCRGREIQGYLDMHPEIRSFVIIDDDTDMGLLRRRLVRTAFRSGLTEYDAARAIDILTQRTT